MLLFVAVFPCIVNIVLVAAFVKLTLLLFVNPGVATGVDEEAGALMFWVQCLWSWHIDTGRKGGGRKEGMEARGRDTVIQGKYEEGRRIGSENCWWNWTMYYISPTW